MTSLSRYFILMLTCVSGFTFSQEAPQPVPAASSSDSVTASASLNITESSGRLLIQSVKVKTRNGEKREGEVIAKFGDTLEFKILNVERLLERRTLSNPIILYANQLPLEGIRGHFLGNDLTKLEFILEHSAVDHPDWNAILRTGFIEKTLFVSVGLKDATMVTEMAVPISFYLRSMNELIPFSFLVLLIGGLTLYLVFRKGLLRVNTGGDNSFSLSTIHLFFWTMIILISYFVIWYTCNDINALEPSCLILIGISAGTASAGTIINNSLKKNQSPDPADVHKSEGFFNDIFSENGAICIHRYQIVVFNLVVGVFFLYNVFSELKMPVLSETILTLLGISSATYASLKAIQVKSANTREEVKQNEAAPVTLNVSSTDNTGSNESQPQ